MKLDPKKAPWNVPTDPDEYDRWFRAKVQEALDDPHPGYSSEEVEAYFRRKRAEILKRHGGS